MNRKYSTFAEWDKILKEKKKKSVNEKGIRSLIIYNKIPKEYIIYIFFYKYFSLCCEAGKIYKLIS
jgi:hypothetical protein